MAKLTDIQNKERIAVVTVGYNRLNSMQRLLSSLLNADYSKYVNVPLVISLDCSGCTELYNYVNNFSWPFGDKYVRIQEKRLGLKQHILTCGDLTDYFKAVILLEDDIFVAKDFYNYSVQMVDAYESDSTIASISLYSNEMNGFCWLPLTYLHNNSDVFAVQAVSTWGECWTSKMWREFRLWLSNAEIPWDDIDMPLQIKHWGNAWSKFFDAYMILENKFSIFPYTSLTTNFSDAGEHGGANNTIVQVNLQYGNREYHTKPFAELVHYDIYSNNIDIAAHLNIPLTNLCIDLYGIRPNNTKKRYYLTVKRLPYKVIKSFGLYLRPQELNVIENIDGNDIFLYDTSEMTSMPMGFGVTKRIMYYLHGFNYKYLPAACWGNILVLGGKIRHKYFKKKRNDKVMYF